MRIFKCLHAYMHRWKKILFADLSFQARGFEQRARGAVGVGDFQRDTLSRQFPAQRAQRFDVRHVEVRNRLSIEQEPSHRRGTGGEEVWWTRSAR